MTEHATAIAVPAEPTDITTPTTSIDLARIANTSVLTRLPIDAVIQINKEVGDSLRISQADAQSIISRYEDVCTGLGEIAHDINAIVVTDSTQKEAMDAAHKARMLLVKMRGELDRVRKDEMAQAKDRISFGDGSARGIRLFIEGLEAHAKYQEEFKKRELAEKRQRLFDERQAIIKPFLGPNDLEPHGLADMTDEAFVASLESIRSRFYERLTVSRQATLNQYEYDAPVDNLQFLSDEAFADLVSRAKAAFDDQKADIARKAQKREDRIKQLSQIGMKFAPSINAFAYEQVAVVYDAQITSVDDVEFATMISGFKHSIDARELAKANEASAVKATEDRRIARINRLSEIGMVFDGVNYSYEELNFSNFSLNSESDSDFEQDFAIIAPEVQKRVARKAEEERIAREAAETERLARLKADALRLAPDKDKLLAFAAFLLEIDIPEVMSDEAVAIRNMAYGSIRDLATSVEAAASALTSDADCPF